MQAISDAALVAELLFDLQTLVIEPPRLCIIALLLSDPTKLVQESGYALLMPKSLQHRQRPLVSLPRRLVLAAQQAHRSGVASECYGRVLITRRLCCPRALLATPDRFVPVAAHAQHPAHTSSPHHSKHADALPVAQAFRHVHCRREVLLLRFQRVVSFRRRLLVRCGVAQEVGDEAAVVIITLRVLLQAC